MSLHNNLHLNKKNIEFWLLVLNGQDANIGERLNYTRDMH